MSVPLGAVQCRSSDHVGATKHATHNNTDVSIPTNTTISPQSRLLGLPIWGYLYHDSPETWIPSCRLALFLYTF